MRGASKVQYLFLYPVEIAVSLPLSVTLGVKGGLMVWTLQMPEFATKVLMHVADTDIGFDPAI